MIVKINKFDGSEERFSDGNVFYNRNNGKLCIYDKKTNCLIEFIVRDNILYDPIEGIEKIGEIIKGKE